MTYIERIYDASNNETSERPYTELEIVAIEANEKEAKKRIEELKKQEILKEAAIEKLSNLGLTIDDLRALGLA